MGEALALHELSALPDVNFHIPGRTEQKPASAAVTVYSHTQRGYPARQSGFSRRLEE